MQIEWETCKISKARIGERLLILAAQTNTDKSR